MGNLSKTMMIISLVCVIICFGASMWMTFALKGENADSTFYVMDALFGAAIIWLAFNLKSMNKKD
ncbi:MAG: hypothetical protein J6R36_05765 [Bacteroidaceae bacterium]|jgi:hypothetical protein|nr:hypothetical protein [Bacteroidaceae bacterium]